MKIIAGRVAALMWCVRQNSNAKVWSNTQLSAEQVGNQAFQLWKNWFDAQQVCIQAQQPRTVQHVASWTKPRDGWLKVNVDAGFFKHQGITTTACCTRNSDGEFLCAQTNQYSSNMSILEGEGMALLDAVKLATLKGWNYVIFESDSQTLVNAINSRNGRVSVFGSIIDNIKNNLFLLSNFEVKFVRRQANMAAHSLARAAISWTSHHYVDVIPLCIEPLLMNDMN
jgi:ribonuclease HI